MFLLKCDIFILDIIIIYTKLDNGTLLSLYFQPSELHERNEKKWSYFSICIKGFPRKPETKSRFVLFFLKVIFQLSIKTRRMFINEKWRNTDPRFYGACYIEIWDPGPMNYVISLKTINKSFFELCIFKKHRRRCCVIWQPSSFYQHIIWRIKASVFHSYC